MDSRSWLDRWFDKRFEKRTGLKILSVERVRQDKDEEATIKKTREKEGYRRSYTAEGVLIGAAVDHPIAGGVIGSLVGEEETERRYFLTVTTKSGKTFHYETDRDRWSQFKDGQPVKALYTEVVEVSRTSYKGEAPYEARTVLHQYLNAISPLEKAAESGSAKGLEAKAKADNSPLGPALILIGLVGAILFFSSNVTGFAIASLSKQTNNGLGALFFLMGIFGFWIYSRKK